MEWFPCDLFEFMYGADKPSYSRPEATAKEICFAILNGLDHCHATGFAHRDFKPESILVDAMMGSVKIAILARLAEQLGLRQDASTML